MTLLVLRPQPGAAATAARARALGLDPVIAPLFRIVPRAWALPDARFDALLMTSANAARAIGTAPAGLAGLPLYAVGHATAEAAAAAGFVDIRTGPGDVAGTAARAAADGVRALLHLAGADRVPSPALPEILPVTVYASEAVDPPPALPPGPHLALLHSPRAARHYRALVAPDGAVPARHRIAAISPAVAAAAGTGWDAVGIAPRSDDDALLAVAARLCQG
ncbi:uroporphyrinogen III synthase HEM4 [Sphingomonas changnyeongensis]|uniref:Uroporphyrinogen III synthase HEM4 n=1 Tax=Sphingomonas changnyeongensis TaxID=2698679 RepID=A0A7Z2S5C2_9SPHN|nr:uroporphyrinogen-III synthase [Sphingomonas changnyeongensis]QHL90208.1 uroporphyrinogen III synthase HEM4 [Sphingomonas changnyeongensis]